MTTTVFILGSDQRPPSALSPFDSARQGASITSYSHFRGGIVSPRLVGNNGTAIHVSGTLLTTDDVRYFDDTVIEPSSQRQDHLRGDRPKYEFVPSHQIEQRDLGTLSEGQKMRAGQEPYRDADRWDPATYLLLSDTGYPNSSALRNVYFDNPYRADGVLEPFPIRSVASLSSVESPFESRGTKGALCTQAASDPLGRAVPIRDRTNLTDPSAPFFLDAPLVPVAYTPVGTSAATGSMFDAGVINDVAAVEPPFVDTTDKRESSLLYNDPEIRSLMLSGSYGFLGDTQGASTLNNPGDLLATAGSVVRPTQLKENVIQGTDSLAFVGLRR